MQIKLKSYSELVQMGKEAIDAALAPSRAKSQRKKAELVLAQMEETCASLEHKITEACSVKEINFDKVLDAVDEFELADRRRIQMEELLSQLFPAEAKA